MTTATPENFFDDAVRESAPSYKFISMNDFVKGEILEQNQTDAKVFNKEEFKLDKKGNRIPVLIVTLQTELRNWDHVTKVPLIDYKDKSKGTKDPSLDDGKRTLFIEKWTNTHAAVGQAVIDATGERGPIRNGGILGIQLFDEEDTGKGQPLRKYRAIYTPPAASSGDFFATPAVQQAPAQQAPAQQQAATPAQQAANPFSTPAPAPVQGDPWAERTDEPPF